MNPRLKQVLYVIAALWIVIGMAFYCYAFTRDFYAVNKHRIDALLVSVGL